MKTKERWCSGQVRTRSDILPLYSPKHIRLLICALGRGQELDLVVGKCSLRAVTSPTINGRRSPMDPCCSYAPLGVG